MEVYLLKVAGIEVVGVTNRPVRLKKTKGRAVFIL